MKRKKYILLSLTIIMVLFSFLAYHRGVYTVFNMEKVKRIKAEEALDLLREKSMTILDVRDEYEYTVSHLNGAVRYEKDLLGDLDKNEPILLYCTVSLRSNKLAKQLQKQGFNEVYELKNGLIGWSNASLPMVNAENSNTEEVHVYNRFFGTFLKKGKAIY
ncbi:rhodanese-like domain-containing protein [Roseivirga sp.]|uniref:rhodanese-like domain-containing protein n=1 Tax=Roseivirga sp. TaxID=1964215 RepID=UPI003B8B7DE2